LPALCARYSVRYLRRATSEGAKAGNLNFGLAHSEGDVILVLDADFQATTNILWRMVGLLEDSVALVQTPQHYYSTDPIQHNLGGGRAWTEEQRHFFDVVLPARDAWGSAVCVGTGFVVLRDALGPEGFPTGCLSEDVYLGQVLRSRGYKLRYLNEVLAYGAAADSLPEYIRQRIRWCQGSIQFLWLPYGAFRAPGLSLLERLFYLEMPLYWVSQFLFLALMMFAPLAYFWAGVPVFSAPLDDAVSYVVPRIFVVAAVTYWISGGRIMPIRSSRRSRRPSRSSTFSRPWARWF
jgi:cellulose synthase (UDP-forming)